MNYESWKIKDRPPAEFLETFPEYPEFVSHLLWNRDLRTQKDIDEFFNPDYETDLGDPLLMKGMGQAVERITRAIKRKEKIVLFGDYDADGVTSSAIMHLLLRDLGVESEVYFPDRVNREGHGLSERKIRDFAAAGATLLITLDCGTSNAAEIGLAREFGLETIVIDHHLITEQLPPAVAVVNPKRRDETYPFIHFSSAGLAFKLAQALMKETQNPAEGFPQLPNGYEKWFLDLVAISTVGDWMPLSGENRTLVKYGLYVLAQTRRSGLKELMNVAGIAPTINLKALKTNLNSEILAYSVVPRINAASRMKHAQLSFALLTAVSPSHALELACELEQSNRERKEVSGQVLREAEQRIAGRQKLDDVIFEFSKEWPIGVLGIISGRIAQKYGRPAFIGSQDGTEVVYSVRSGCQINVMEALEHAAHLLKRFGGHASAAGCTVVNENVPALKSGLESFMKKRFGQGSGLRPLLEVDCELRPEEVKWQLYDWLDRFEPFGKGNPKPLFVIKNVFVREARRMGGEGAHMRLTLESGNGKLLKAVGFGMGEWVEKLFTEFHKETAKADVVFELIADEWNGTRELKLKLHDIRFAL